MAWVLFFFKKILPFKKNHITKQIKEIWSFLQWARLPENQWFWGPYQERACEDKFGAVGGEVVLPAELQQISPLHRNELHLPALRSPVEEAYLLVSLVARITDITSNRQITDIKCWLTKDKLSSQAQSENKVSELVIFNLKNVR